jgi:hypothetical protein
MSLFSLARICRRMIVLLVMLTQLACSAYSQIRRDTILSSEKPLYLRSAAFQRATTPDESIYQLIREKKKMKRMDNLLKRRVSGTNAVLSELETNARANNQHLLKKISYHIDSLKSARAYTNKNYKTEGKRNPLTDQQCSKLRTSVVDREKNARKKAAWASKKTTDLPVIEPINQLKTLRPDSASLKSGWEALLQRTTYGQVLKELGDSRAEELLQNQALSESINALQDTEHLQHYLQAKAAKLATADFAAFAPQLQNVQESFVKYKRKMAWLKEGSGPNANALTGESMTKRLIYGGGLQNITLAPFSAVAAPFLGYQLTRKLSAGMRLSYKMVTGSHLPSTKPFGGEVGYSSFSEWKLFDAWFVHGEFERMSKAIPNGTKEGYEKHWRNNAYLGIGKQISVAGNLRITGLLLYNVLSNCSKDTFRAEPFQFRVSVSRQVIL